jgi:exopolysaccharide biosynthesis protein
MKENVCLTINEDNTIYAVGSASHVELLDANGNNARQLTEPILIKNDIGKI